MLNLNSFFAFEPLISAVVWKGTKNLCGSINSLPAHTEAGIRVSSYRLRNLIDKSIDCTFLVRAPLEM